MNAAGGVLRRVTEALESAQVPNMLTGSVAAAYHGAPRATVDLDLVVAATASQVHQVVASCLADGFYASEEAATESLRSGGMFNVIDGSSGWKVDLIHRRDRPFSAAEFARRRRDVLQGVSVDIATLEDVILSKLEWASLGGSARQLEDVATLLRVRRGEVDLAYVQRWVPQLGVGSQWAEVQRELERDLTK
jgi:hypothetical protein